MKSKSTIKEPMALSDTINLLPQKEALGIRFVIEGVVIVPDIKNLKLEGDILILDKAGKYVKNISKLMLDLFIKGIYNVDIVVDKSDISIEPFEENDKIETTGLEIAQLSQSLVEPITVKGSKNEMITASISDRLEIDIITKNEILSWNDTIDFEVFKGADSETKDQLKFILSLIYMMGSPVQSKIVIVNADNDLILQFAKTMSMQISKYLRMRGLPIYNPNKPAVFEIDTIRKMLPHRYPFLLVDRIIELSAKHVVGIKNVSMNEQFFVGHFPDFPIFPGVLQMEALAQTGGILAMQTVENPEEYDTIFLKLNNVKFKKMVRPGDTMILKLELLSPIKMGIFHMQGTVYVGNQQVSEGELTARIMKKTPI